MKVEVRVPQDILEIIYVAARTCYSGKGPIELLGSLPSEAEMSRLVRDVTARGHLSVLEHGTVTIFVEGISRACSHQLVRHRLMSVSQQSQRYVKKTPGFVVPYSPAFSYDVYGEIQTVYDAAYKAAEAAYKRLLSLGIKPEDARYVLPNATTTNLVVTMNLRELMHVCGVRRCSRAQEEIRELFDEVASQMIKELPSLEGCLGPKCAMLGYCPEKDSCGRMPQKHKVLKASGGFIP